MQDTRRSVCIQSEIARIPLRRFGFTWAHVVQHLSVLLFLRWNEVAAKDFLHEDQSLPTLRSRSPCASCSPSPLGGLCGMCHWLSPHRTTLPVRAVQVTAAPWTNLVATVVYKMLYVMGSNGLQHQLVPCLWGRTKILDLKLVSLADSGSVCVVEHVFL